MPEMKTLNGYEVVDAKARQDIEVLKNTEVDLTPYATKSELPTKVSQLQNDSRFITLEEVPATDLSAYAKKTDIPDVSGFITSIPSEYVTESELNAKGYLTQEDLPASIDTSRFLTKVNNNDQYMWYATTTNANQVIQNHVPIEKLDSKLDIVVGGKTLNNNTIAVRQGLQIRVPEAPTNAGHAASKAYVDKAIAAIPEVDLSSYAKKTDIPDVSGFISEIPSEYVTDSELAAKGYLVEANLSEYAKKSEIPTVPTKTSQLTNDSNFLTAIPAEYITETELNNKGYLTQHQSLEGYATKTYVDNAIAGIDIPGGAGGIVTYTFNGDDSRNVITDEERAVVEAVYRSIANGTGEHEDYLLYVHTSKGVFPVISVKYNASDPSPLKFIYNHDIGTGQLIWNYIGFNIDASTGKCSQRQRGSESVNSKNWYWSDTYTSINVPSGTYRHVKIVGYYGTDSSNVATFDMSCPYNGKFRNSDSNIYFVFPDVFKVSQDGLLKWHYESSAFKLYVNGEVDTNFKCTGVWMQTD